MTTVAYYINLLSS